MKNILTKLIGDRREWKRMQARARVLPQDHQVVYSEMAAYMWRFTSSDGLDILDILKEILEEFEGAAARHQPVLAVTGEDVAAYCDSRLDSVAPVDRYLEKWRTSLNEDVRNQL